MRVFLTVEDRWQGARRDLLVDVPEGATVGDLCAVLDAEPGQGGAWHLAGRVLDPAELLADLLRDGQVLAKGRPGADGGRDPEGRLELRVVGGPEAGAAWLLAPGRYLVGRGEEADLRLARDQQASRRHASVLVRPEGLAFEDAGAANGVLVDGHRVASAEVAPGQQVQLGESVLAWRWPPAQDAVALPDGQGRVAFNRPPRIRDPHAVRRVTLPASGGEAALAEHRRRGRLGGRQRARAAAEELAQERERALGEVGEAAAAEELEARASFPDPAEVASIAWAPRSRLWERRREDDDFALFRLGLGDRPAELELVEPGAATGGPASAGGAGLFDAELRAAGQLHQVPAVLDLAAAGVLGVAGPRPSCQALARWLLAQAATFHSPEDLLLTVLSDESQEAAWSFVRWLPHARPADGSAIARVGSTPATVARLAGSLAALVDERARAREERAPGSAAPLEPLHLVVLDGAYLLGQLPAVARLLRRGAEVGVVTVALEDAAPLLPEECSTTVLFSADEPARCALHASREAARSDLLADLVSPAWAEQLARAVAPLRLARRSEDLAVLPSQVRLLELLQLDPPVPEVVRAAWERGGRSTAATVGLTPTGPLALDLRRDGPHGLVAGTTGSGKSELLQSLIASLAVTNRPDALNFVLVDYKGGSAFKECAELPHTVGVVTDLDGHLTERALQSLAAELRRRERLFQAAGARDIEEYRHAASGAARPLARLVLVIDEFAFLAEELPGFVDGLVDLARRGRSLGIHLLLSTQRPSGVVSPAIRTNTNLRISMRVTDAADSLDVLDSPVAARIAKETPGRGFVRVGHEQMTEFQAARIGGRRRSAAAAAKSVRVHEVGWAQLGEEAPSPEGGAGMADSTDLAELAGAVQAAAAALGLPPQRSPWLPPLPELVQLQDLEVPAGGVAAPFGLEDRPAEQRREVAALDLERTSHLLVVGDAGSGRSSFLRTLACSLALACGVEDVHLYGIDCANGALLALEELPHCGAVASRMDPERVERLIEKLAAETERRQRLLAEGGYTSIADQRRSAPAGERLPHLVLLLDRWEGFIAAFDQLDNGRLVASLLQLLREATGAGLRVVLTGDRSALTGRLASLAEQVLLLRLNDRGAYSLAGLAPRAVPELLGSGRGVWARSGIEVQLALLDPDPAGAAQLAALHRVAAVAARRSAALPREAFPEPIAVLPRRLPRSALAQHPGGGPAGPLRAALGVGGDRLDVQTVDLAATGGGFLVGGPARSGRSNALAVLGHSLLERGHRLLCLLPRRSPLAELAGQAGVAGVLASDELEGDRLPDLLAGAGAGGGLVVLVDDAERLVQPQAVDALTDFLRAARDTGNGLVAAGTTAELTLSLRGFVPEVRRARAGLLLCPSAPADGELLGTRLSRTACFSEPPGRGLLVAEGRTVLVQVALAEAGGEAQR